MSFKTQKFDSRGFGGPRYGLANCYCCAIIRELPKIEKHMILLYCIATIARKDHTSIKGVGLLTCSASVCVLTCQTASCLRVVNCSPLQLARLYLPWSFVLSRLKVETYHFWEQVMQ